MDFPFYRIHRNYPSSHPRYGYSSSSSPHQIPVYQQTSPAVPRKVVSIPVSDGRSKWSRPDSAIKIQKGFRGFLVRKSVKKILSIKREVDEIERKISASETVELIRREEAREQLRINEMLMGLLLKLDSVRGVDSAVRDFRKVVIKKAIALQERVDCIAAHGDAANENNIDDDAETAGEGDEACEVNGSVDDCECNLQSVDELQNPVDSQALGDAVSLPEESREEEMQILDMACEGERNEKSTEVEGDDDLKNKVKNETALPVSVSDCGAQDAVGEVSETPELLEAEKADMGCECDRNAELSEVGEEDGDVENQAEKDADVVVSASGCVESFGASQPESRTDSSANPECLRERRGENSVSNLGGESEKHDNVKIHEPDLKEGEATLILNDVGEEESRRSRELVDRMVEDKKKMMGQMAELFQRNEWQTRLLSSLSQRVAQLERAYICEMLKKKKRRNGASGLVDCLESTQDSKRCGKKL